MFSNTWKMVSSLVPTAVVALTGLIFAVSNERHVDWVIGVFSAMAVEMLIRWSRRIRHRGRRHVPADPA